MGVENLFPTFTMGYPSGPAKAGFESWTHG